MINAESVRKGTFFSQSAMILLDVSKIHYDTVSLIEVDVTLHRMYVTTRLRSKMTLFSPFFLDETFFFS